MNLLEIIDGNIKEEFTVELKFNNDLTNVKVKSVGYIYNLPKNLSDAKKTEIEGILSQYNIINTYQYNHILFFIVKLTYETDDFGIIGGMKVEGGIEDEYLLYGIEYNTYDSTPILFKSSQYEIKFINEIIRLEKFSNNVKLTYDYVLKHNNILDIILIVDDYLLTRIAYLLTDGDIYISKYITINGMLDIRETKIDLEYKVNKMVKITKYDPTLDYDLLVLDDHGNIHAIKYRTELYSAEIIIENHSNIVDISYLRKDRIILILDEYGDLYQVYRPIQPGETMIDFLTRRRKEQDNKIYNYKASKINSNVDKLNGKYYISGEIIRKLYIEHKTLYIREVLDFSTMGIRIEYNNFNDNIFVKYFTFE